SVILPLGGIGGCRWTMSARALRTKIRCTPVCGPGPGRERVIVLPSGGWVENESVNGFPAVTGPPGLDNGRPQVEAAPRAGAATPLELLPQPPAQPATPSTSATRARKRMALMTPPGTGTSRAAG